MTDGSKGLYNTAQISVMVENGTFRIYGAQQLIADGYVPYLSSIRANETNGMTRSHLKPLYPKVFENKSGTMLIHHGVFQVTVGCDIISPDYFVGRDVAHLPTVDYPNIHGKWAYGLLLSCNCL